MENAGMFITKKHGDATIMIYLDADAWEVYYKKPGYSFIYAFGLPSDHLPDDVFEIAAANIDNYSDLFD
jgi:hypothetical protein